MAVKKAEAVKALDDQIVIAKADAEKILSEKGSSSDEYRKAMQNLKELCEARAAVADSNPKKQSNGIAAACIAGVFGLGQTFLLLIHDDDHCIPKWFKSGIDGIKLFLRGKD
jgi:hypothetical protein